MLRQFFFVCCFVVLSTVAIAAEDVVVIVNQKNGVNKMTRDEVINVFLGRSRQLASGVTALPLDLPSSSAERAQFYQLLTGKSINEINAYWARLLFSGRASPPTQVRNPEEAVQMVIDNRSAVAYVARNKVSSSAVIVFELTAK
jgi:ABC-type phosphate transport system substrate-binding protein